MRQEGLEPPTRSLEGCRSIQLSYWRMAPAAGAESTKRRPSRAISRPRQPERSELQWNLWSIRWNAGATTIAKAISTPSPQYRA